MSRSTVSATPPSIPSSSTGLSPLHTIPQSVHTLATPVPSFIDNTLPSYLTSCMISTLRASTRHVVQKKKQLENELREGGLIPPLRVGEAQRSEADEVDEGLQKRLKTIGIYVGANVVERLSIGRPPFPSDLEAIKFLCKELFIHIYSRQIDNLRTNHRGTFVLSSNALPPLIPLSTANGPAADLKAGILYMVFPSGLLQGALERLGISATVLAESNGLPRCTFQIRTHQLPQLPPPSVGDQANASLTATATTMTIAPSNDAPMMASQQTARPSGHAPQTIESALTSVPSPAPTATQAQAHAPEQTQPSASPSPSPSPLHLRKAIHSVHSR